jgi:hypothetical protein
MPTLKRVPSEQALGKQPEIVWHLGRFSNKFRRLMRFKEVKLCGAEIARLNVLGDSSSCFGNRSSILI